MSQEMAVVLLQPVITSTIDCAIVYKLSWTQPLSVATPAQYREHEYTGGNIWVLIADIKNCDVDKTNNWRCFDQDREGWIVSGMSSLFLFHVQSSYSVYSSSF